MWNNLDPEKQNSESLAEFKGYLTPKIKKPSLLYYGDRWINVHHARMRMGCSLLKYDLFYNIHVIPSPVCSCGLDDETIEHFFLQCPIYADLRVNLLEAFHSRGIENINMDILLNGSSDLSNEENKIIFSSIYSYMNESRRFIEI
jgi:hypothetical protein